MWFCSLSMSISFVELSYLQTQTTHFYSIIFYYLLAFFIRTMNSTKIATKKTEQKERKKFESFSNLWFVQDYYIKILCFQAFSKTHGKYLMLKRYCRKYSFTKKQSTTWLCMAVSCMRVCLIFRFLLFIPLVLFAHRALLTTNNNIRCFYWFIFFDGNDYTIFYDII